MKILLTSLNARYSQSNLAIYYLQKYCQYTEHDFFIRQYTINQTLESIITDIQKNKPDVIAFSTYIWNMEKTTEVCSILKKENPKIIIIAGGPEVSYNEKWQQLNIFDYIIQGRGENAFKNLAQQNFKADKKILPLHDTDFTTVPFPYSIANLQSHHDKLLYYESSRGCPYSCSFCLSSVKTETMQFKEIEVIKKELLMILQHYKGTVKFVDRTFNAKKKHYQQIWNFLIENYREQLTFHFEIYPEHLAPEDFMILQKAPSGYFQFETGIQSTDPRVLQSIGRKQNFQKIKDNIAQLLSLNTIHIHTDQIAGLPGEDKESMKKSFNEIYLLNGHHFQPGILKVIPGTILQARAHSQSLHHSLHPPYEILSTALLNNDDIIEYKNTAQAVEIAHNSGKFPCTLELLTTLFSSPYELFREISSAPQWHEDTLNKWDKAGLSILHLVHKNFSDMCNNIKDALTCDFAQHCRSHHLPGYINDLHQKNCRTEMLKNLHRFKKGDRLAHEVLDVPFSEIKKSIFIKPRSDYFKNKIKGDENCLMILPDCREFSVSVSQQHTVLRRL